MQQAWIMLPQPGGNPRCAKLQAGPGLQSLHAACDGQQPLTSTLVATFAGHHGSVCRGGAGHGHRRQLPRRLHRTPCGALLHTPLHACGQLLLCVLPPAWRALHNVSAHLGAAQPAWQSSSIGGRLPPQPPPPAGCTLLQGMPAECAAAVSALLPPAVGGVNVTGGLLWVNAYCEANFTLPEGGQPAAEGQQQGAEQGEGELAGRAPQHSSSTARLVH
jgi:hypothetical protein